MERIPPNYWHEGKSIGDFLWMVDVGVPGPYGGAIHDQIVLMT